VRRPLARPLRTIEPIVMEGVLLVLVASALGLVSQLGDAALKPYSGGQDARAAVSGGSGFELRWWLCVRNRGLASRLFPLAALHSLCRRCRGLMRKPRFGPERRGGASVGLVVVELLWHGAAVGGRLFAELYAAARQPGFGDHWRRSQSRLGRRYGKDEQRITLGRDIVASRSFPEASAAVTTCFRSATTEPRRIRFVGNRMTESTSK